METSIPTIRGHAEYLGLWYTTDFCRHRDCGPSIMLHLKDLRSVQRSQLNRTKISCSSFSSSNGNKKQKAFIIVGVLFLAATVSVTAIYLPLLAVNENNSRNAGLKQNPGVTGGSMWSKIDRFLKSKKTEGE